MLGRSIVLVATVVAACGPRAKTPAHDDANEWALEPARPAEVTAWIEHAQANAERTGDAEGQRVLAALARRPPTNASRAFAGCVIATDGGDGRLPQAVDPESPCDNPDIPSGAGLRCCKAPSPALESCGYCDEAAREDSTLSEIARRYERRCKQQNQRREATFEREAAHAWVAWARARGPAERDVARSALGRARKAMEAATAVDGTDDTALRREIMETERAFLAATP